MHTFAFNSFKLKARTILLTIQPSSVQEHAKLANPEVHALVDTRMLFNSLKLKVRSILLTIHPCSVQEHAKPAYARSSRMAQFRRRNPHPT
jgi:hypothetical protein